MQRAWVQIAIACVSIAAVANVPVEGAEIPSWRVSPAAVLLDNPEATQQLLITSVEGQVAEDLTRSVSYQSADANVAFVTSTGRVFPRNEGTTEIIVRHEKAESRIPVEVRGLKFPAPVSFRYEVLPILSKAGCNSGGCHGKAEGQNGFKLSIFGFDAEADHDALIKEGHGRRVSLSAPRASLLLRKATGETPHGGGGKIEKESLWYRRLERWLAEGARLDDETTPQITAIEIEPTELVMRPMATQQIRVTAIDSTGARRCVTPEAEFQSNAEAIAEVDPGGLIAVSDVPGEAAILVRYMDKVGVCRVILPQSGVSFSRPPENNFIDKLAWDKLQRLGIRPSELANDATFLRRVYLDTIGTLPTADEARDFLSDKASDKRSNLIDQLLDRDEYADFQALRWADILRVDQSIVTPQGAVAMTRWLRNQFQQNRPYDQFARAILTAKGNTLAESPAAFYQVHKDPQMLGNSISQVFLGVHLECAQCHHHPFERWSQQDYFAFAGFFTGVGRKVGPLGGQKIFAQTGTDLKHPRTEQPVPAAGLGSKPIETSPLTDRRTLLADWVTSPSNPFFARMIVNRIWGQYFGRGLVEPLDDLRTTNPATNEPLLGALAKYVVDSKFDLKELTRVILNSRLYQLSSEPENSNESDRQNHSHAMWKALPAEVLLDAICQATDVSEQFNGWPEGYRAMQIWDNRMPSYFFQIFGRPQRVSVCECERGNEPSIAQALHLMNSPETVHKIRHRDGRIARLAISDLTDAQIIEELYLTTLSRFPQVEEIALMRQAFAESNGDRRSAAEDILWALLNTREFVYNH